MSSAAEFCPGSLPAPGTFLWAPHLGCWLPVIPRPPGGVPPVAGLPGGIPVQLPAGFLPNPTDMDWLRRRFEIAGLVEEQPTLRRFTRYNQSMYFHQPPPAVANQNTMKSAKKGMFGGNWTFREKKSSSASARPTVTSAHFADQRRDDRPSVTISAPRSRSEAPAPSTPLNPQNGARPEFQIPIRMVHSPRTTRQAPAPPSGQSQSQQPTQTVRPFQQHQPQAAPLQQSPSKSSARLITRSSSPLRGSRVYARPRQIQQTAEPAPVSPASSHRMSVEVSEVYVDDDSGHHEDDMDSPPQLASLGSFSSAQKFRKSCPDLENAGRNMEPHRVSHKRNRRAKEKQRDARWQRIPLQEWQLDDVLLWLQHCRLDQVASILIGYEVRGSDLLSWDNNILAQLGVTDPNMRAAVLRELEAIKARKEDEAATEVSRAEEKAKRNTLFDIVNHSQFDQVLAFETALTARDLTVSRGRLGCLQITRVNGAGLPLRENDCLLEINRVPGDAFKSALQLTTLIANAKGAPIRFVVLRRKGEDENAPGAHSDIIKQQTLAKRESESSGISSSLQTSSDSLRL